MSSLKNKKNKALKMMMWFGVGSLFMTFAGLSSAFIVSKNRQDWVENFDKNAQENKLIVSGGEAQRLALLRNFFNDQKSILILDEPTSALDEYTKKQAAFLIQKV